LKEICVKVELDPPLKKRLETMAQSERRTLSSQTTCLLEKGLFISERQMEIPYKNKFLKE
jgi:predicted transcriptional regulator